MVRCYNKVLQQVHQVRKKVSFSPTQLTENFFFLPSGDKLVNFSFKDRPYFYRIYNENHPHQLLMCGRQTGKSTNINNKLLSYSMLVDYFMSLYVSPTASQTSDFSKLRMQPTIKYSPILNNLEDRRKVSKITHKAFQTGSEILLGYAFLNADRIRGKTADLVCVDELQDIISELLPIIEETSFTSKYKIKIYAGTPKSTSNTIHHQWQQSTQCEWLVPCEHCGTSRAHGGWRTWNILGEPNIGKTGVICAKCGKPVNPCHPDARWIARNPHPRGVKGEILQIPFHGYHISQLMHPMDAKAWISLLDKYNKYNRAQFFNEVLGLSYDSGLRPVNPGHIQDCCNPKVSMESGHGEWGPERFKRWVSRGVPCFMGIDWGSAENTFTVVTLGMYTPDNRFTIFYVRRCTGPDAEPDRQLALIESLVDYYRPMFIGTDYGGGFYMNDQLVRRFGHDRVAKYQYAGAKEKVVWAPKLGRWLANRTEVMSDIFNAIRKGTVFGFPCWEDFEQPFAQDILNIHGEYNPIRDTTKYDVAPGTTDDTLHSILYCFLASHLYRPRPDILYPRREEGFLLS